MPLAMSAIHRQLKLTDPSKQCGTSIPLAGDHFKVKALMIIRQGFTRSLDNGPYSAGLR